MSYDLKLLNRIRKNVNNPNIFYCPQCGYKTFSFKRDCFACINRYCQLEIGYTGSEECIKDWKQDMIDLIKAGGMLGEQGCDDETCEVCKIKDSHDLKRYH